MMLAEVQNCTVSFYCLLRGLCVLYWVQKIEGRGEGGLKTTIILLNFFKHLV